MTARIFPTILWVVLLAYFFANIEIQIEGADGWATSLPTWRIEEHWLLDVFWGSRAMTGYHAWVFPFIALVFHLPIFFIGQWSLRLECRILACIMVFWVVEDFLWFVLNPAYGVERFTPETVAWHKYWLWGAPIDYWIYLPLSAALLWFSASRDRKTEN